MSGEESYNTIGLPSLPVRNKLSILRVGVWQFIDARVINWKVIDSFTSEYTVVDTHGIVLSSSRLPEQYVDKINPGETIVRDLSDPAVVTFYKKPKNEII